MFFIMGISDGRRDLEHSQLMTCDDCGAYGRYRVYMTYMVLSLFFIPCLKWNRKYYVETSCCSALYELDPQVGNDIARGRQVEIQPAQLKKVQRRGYGMRSCASCGYATAEDFEFCPRCGRRF